MSTSSVSSAGMGIALTGITGMAVTASVSAVAAILGIVLAYFLVNDYFKTKNALKESIKRQKERKVMFEHHLADTRFEYFKRLLQLRFLLSHHTAIALRTMVCNQCSKIMLSDALFDRIESLYEERKNDAQFVKKVVNHHITNEDLGNHEDLQHVLSEAITPKPHPTPRLIDTTVSLMPAIKTGILGFFSTYGGLLGTAWGLASISTLFGVSIMTPFVGWGILIGAVVLGTVFALMYAHYEHKNTRYEVKRNKLKEDNDEQKFNINEIREDTVLMESLVSDELGNLYEENKRNEQKIKNLETQLSEVTQNQEKKSPMPLPPEGTLEAHSFYHHDLIKFDDTQTQEHDYDVKPN